MNKFISRIVVLLLIPGLAAEPHSIYFHKHSPISFTSCALAPDVIGGEHRILSGTPSNGRLLEAYEETAPKTPSLLDSIERAMDAFKKNSFTEPIARDLELHIASSFTGLQMGGPAKVTSQARYKIFNFRGIPVYIAFPKNMTQDTPILYFNHGGGAEAMFEFRKWLQLIALGVRVQGLFWAPGQIASELLAEGFAVAHVAGADVGDLRRTHSQDAWSASKERSGDILHWLLKSFPGHPLFLVGGSLGGLEILCTLASDRSLIPHIHGVVLANSAVQFTTGAARYLALQSPLRALWWGNEFLPALLPGKKESVDFLERLDNGLQRNLTGRIPLIFINSVAGRNGMEPSELIADYKHFFATRGTDYVVDPLLGGLGTNGRRPLPGALEIEIEGIDHFAFPFHPMAIELGARLAKLAASKVNLFRATVEVNGRIQGRFGQFTFQKNPLRLIAFGKGPFDYSQVLFNTTPAGRHWRQLQWRIADLRRAA